MFAEVRDTRFEILQAAISGHTVWGEVVQRGTESDGQAHHARGVVITETDNGVMTHDWLHLFPCAAVLPPRQLTSACPRRPRFLRSSVKPASLVREG